ncbi:MAG: glycosyltransferase family 2 protein [Bacilli bacterium]|jgi:glycosyltransferase involved in cell wall biosynthesis|nr:glycosyltransferase family 2 protein [Bacilli bacterium]
MKISVVIPVYNAYKHLPKLLETLTNQTHQDLEIILVDNNSKDQSAAYIKEYAKKDSRVIFLTETQQGPNFARKTGFLKATGTYIYFCDADDFVEADALEKMLTAARKEKADVVIGNYQELDETGIVKKACKGVFFPDPTGNLKRYPELILVKPALWNKLFRRSVISEDTFITSKIGEDMVITLLAFAKAKKVIYIDEVIYDYIPAETGLTNSIQPRNLLDIIVTCQTLETLLTKIDRQQLYGETLPFLMFTHVLYRILRSELIKEEMVRRDVYQKLHGYLSTIEYRHNPYYKKKIHYRLANAVLATKALYHCVLVRAFIRFFLTNRTLYRIFKLLDH